MLSALCLLLPTFFSPSLIPLCYPASATSVSSAPDTSTAVDGTQLSPLSVTSRWIVDSNGKRVKMRCVNWAGHLEPNVPEGLSKRTPEDLASWIANAGFNCVRLTYSIDMALSPDTPVSESFDNAANSTGAGSNLTEVYQTATQVNPWLSNSTTLGAFATVISALGDKGIRVVLDNHLSHAGWCCNPVDGNGWWDQASGANPLSSKWFNTTSWLSGLSAMATFAKDHSNVAVMSLRNELRTFGVEDLDNHADWYKFTSMGAQQIRAANPDLLVVFGGPESATDLDFVSEEPLNKTAWGDAGGTKTFYEYHVYDWSFPGITEDCALFNLTMGERVGYLLEQNQSYTGPLWLSEFGVGQAGGPANGLSDGESEYLGCLVDYMENNDADWAVWALQGTYYVRDGTVNYSEGYGILNDDWTDWRNPQFPAMLGAMWNVTQGPL